MAGILEENLPTKISEEAQDVAKSQGVAYEDIAQKEETRADEG